VYVDDETWMWMWMWILLVGETWALSGCSVFNYSSPRSEFPYAFTLQVQYRNFSDARAYCASLHPQADLVIVRDNGVLLDITGRLVSSILDIKPTWIGLYQTSKQFEPNGNWTWLDGSPIDRYVSNWALDRPNNARGIEDCVMSTYTGEYDDNPCNNTNIFYCEVNGKPNTVFVIFNLPFTLHQPLIVAIIAYLD
jgi:hypothetical protein